MIGMMLLESRAQLVNLPQNMWIQYERSEVENEAHSNHSFRVIVDGPESTRSQDMITEKQKSESLPRTGIEPVT